MACVALLLLLTAPEAAAQRAGTRDADCAVCHGELELLRQKVDGLPRARALLVTPAHIRDSAHDGMRCAECHVDFGAFPHPSRARTSTCASCHADADRDWNAGRHARETVEGGIATTCAACHGAHDAAPAARLAEGEPMERLNARCVACHQADALPAGDPHANTVGCWTCHAPHAVHAKDDVVAAIAPTRQAQTCGACHDTASVNWRRDAHGTAALAAFDEPGAAHGLPHVRETPVCTGCHGAHGMVASDDARFATASVAACQACHERATQTFFGSYHGKATALGSRVSAACHDCHGAHEVFAQDDARSTVHETNLVETCRACHEYARPAFVKYDSHPDPFDRERNPWIFYSFWFMNTLLVGVLGVFGLHTVLWWVRLHVDKKRGILHGPHHRHDGRDHHEPPAPGGRAEP